MNELAITVIGRDRPGIVADVAEVLARLGANLTDSHDDAAAGALRDDPDLHRPGRRRGEAALAPLAAEGQLLATVRAVTPDGDVDAGG